MANRSYPNGVHLQRRHFCFIAEVIAKLDGETRQEVAKAFADCLRSTNGQFKCDRFLEACNVANILTDAPSKQPCNPSTIPVQKSGAE
jgi:hypothetical protein